MAEHMPTLAAPSELATAFGEAKIEKIDTVFRAPMLADSSLTISAVVTDMDEEEGTVELDLSIKNQAEETRVFGTATVRLPTA